MIFNDKKIIVLLPPKTGTTSLRKGLKECNLTFKRASGKIHPYLSEILRSERYVDLKDYTIYQLCRNPLDRMVSAYYFQREILKKPPKGLIYYKEFFDMDFNTFLKEVLDNLHYLPKDPASFGREVFRDKDLINAKKRTSRGVRFYIPQTKWNDVGAKINYLKLEDISKDNSIISDIFDVDFKSLHKNKTLTKPKVESISLYSEENLKAMKELYKDDFKILGYE
jgi:hypothetical protein